MSEWSCRQFKLHSRAQSPLPKSLINYPFERAAQYWTEHGDEERAAHCLAAAQAPVDDISLYTTHFPTGWRVWISTNFTAYLVALSFTKSTSPSTVASKNDSTAAQLAERDSVQGKRLALSVSHRHTIAMLHAVCMQIITVVLNEWQCSSQIDRSTTLDHLFDIMSVHRLVLGRFSLLLFMQSTSYAFGTEPATSTCD